MRCACGFDANALCTRCPQCGKVLERPPVFARCACGRDVEIPRGLVGLLRCPACGRSVNVVDGPVTASRPGPAPAPPPVRAAPKPVKPAEPVGALRYPLRWLLVATIIPLFSFLAATNDTRERVEETLEQHPELRGEDLTIDEFCARLPEHKVEGAFVQRGSKIHWLFAIVAATGFWAYVMIAFPLGAAKAGHLWLVGIFTGTIGIFLLLAMQYAAVHTRGVMVGRGATVIIFLIIRFIGFSYAAALDPENGFVASLAGFTLGVGLCEELVKALPLLWIFRRDSVLDVRGAIAWGLATGVGFGVSEGVTYAADYYHGIETGQVYVVRFVSCVGLHAVWSATTALLIWRLREDIAGIEAWYGWIPPIGAALGASMVLHGLYDTFLKREMAAAALAAAVVSLVLFFVLAHRMERREELEAA